MDARRGECAGAGAHGHLPLLEMGEEGVPLFVGGSTVFLAGPGRAAAGDEGPVAGDDLLGVDGLWRTQISQLSEYLPPSRVLAGDLGVVPRAGEDLVGSFGWG